MPTIACSAAAARRHVLDRHHLLAPAPASSVPAVARDLVGLHATGTTGPYLQALARLAAFHRADLDAALYEDRTLLRVRCMRATVFILPRDLARVAMAATRELVVPASTRFMEVVGTTRREYDVLADRIALLLGGAGTPLSAADIKTRLGVTATLSGVVNLMCDEGRLLRDRPAGTWKSRAFTYRIADGLLDDGGRDRDGAIRELVLRYIERYGPVTLADAAWWSGLPLRDVRAAVDAERPRLAEVDVDGWSGTRLVLREDAAALAGRLDPPGEQPLALLPELDPFVMCGRDKSRVIPDVWRDFVVDRAGNATSVVLVDGQVAGVWDVKERPEPALRFLLFERPRAEHVARIRSAAERVGAHWFGRDVPVAEYRDMTPLSGRTAGGFLAPLDGAARAS